MPAFCRRAGNRGRERTQESSPAYLPGAMAPHPFDGVDLRQNPLAYVVGRGEYGLFHAEPYRSELLPHWAFRTPEVARESIAALRERFEGYAADRDFVGMDVARKYIQMGWTRARRYARHPGGRKYDEAGAELPLGAEDPVKAESARLFREALDEVLRDPRYREAKLEWQDRVAAAE